MITVEVHNVSLIPNGNPLTMIEGNQISVRCAVNSNAFPAPTLTWHRGSTDVTKRTGAFIYDITITGDRTDNTKTLECRATNNNKPPKTASTTLNVECKFDGILNN